jgi:hypothetical protein
MKSKLLKEPPPAREEVIATFGEARLVRVKGRVELRGGSMADRTEALEWLLVMMPDEAPRLRR